MSYYNTDINDTPAPGTGHTLKTDTFEEWRKKRDAKEAAAGWNRNKLKADARLTAHKLNDRKTFNK
jgi:hypothetical protein